MASNRTTQLRTLKRMLSEDIPDSRKMPSAGVYTKRVKTAKPKSTETEDVEVGAPMVKEKPVKAEEPAATATIEVEKPAATATVEVEKPAATVTVEVEKPATTATEEPVGAEEPAATEDTIPVLESAAVPVPTQP